MRAKQGQIDTLRKDKADCDCVCCKDDRICHITPHAKALVVLSGDYFIHLFQCFMPLEVAECRQALTFMIVNER
jgi:hypothetical protein